MHDIFCKNFVKFFINIFFGELLLIMCNYLTVAICHFIITSASSVNGAYNSISVNPSLHDLEEGTVNIPMQLINTPVGITGDTVEQIDEVEHNNEISVCQNVCDVVLKDGIMDNYKIYCINSKKLLSIIKNEILPNTKDSSALEDIKMFIESYDSLLLKYKRYQNFPVCAYNTTIWYNWYKNKILKYEEFIKRSEKLYDEIAERLN